MLAARGKKRPWQTRRTIMKTILSAAIALSVLAAVAVPASARPDPRNPAVEIPEPSPN
jgi:hypothetical protein